MKKLALHLDDLAVTSFETGPARADRGTVVAAHGDTKAFTCPVTCGVSCHGTCHETCQLSCDPSCLSTCPPVAACEESCICGAKRA